MGQVVYADLLFLINFSMDFLCFFLTARLLHRKFSIWRSIAGAAMGGIYSVIILVLEMNIFWGISADLGMCALMCICSFGCARKSFYEFFICMSVYFCVSAGMGGFMTALYSLLNRIDLPPSSVRNNGDDISIWFFGLLAAISGIATMLGGRFFRKSSSNQIANVEITYNGSVVSLNGMVDTGNMLSDPISGRPVIVVDEKKLERIVAKETLEGIASGETNLMSENDLEKIRFIPIKTASGSGFMYAFNPERTKITILDKSGKTRSFEVNALFASSKLAFDADKCAAGCAALIPPDLLV